MTEVANAPKKLNADQLCCELGCSISDIRRWSKLEGWPRHGNTKGSWYSLGEVQAWLVSRGLAAFDPAPQPEVSSQSEAESSIIDERDEHGQRICRTFAELANELRRPQRVIQRWATELGFPGTPGTPGRRDGHFPVDEIEEWAKARFAKIDSRDSELQEAKKRLALLEIQEQELEARKRLGQLLDFADVAGFFESCVVNAKAVLGQIPDEVLSMLPESMVDEARGDIFRRVSRRIDDALAEISALMDGDTDSIDEDDEVSA